MAKLEHVEIFQQGVEAWNEWRREHRDIQPDLRGIKLVNAQLDAIRLSFSQLQAVHFEKASLQRAYLVSSDLSSAQFPEVSLHEAYLDSAKLPHANLRGARLSHAKMRIANLSGADLSHADLSYANLERTNLSYACLSGTDFSFARLGRTDLSNVDLRTAKGLETVVHAGPSHVGLQTLMLSRQSIPAAFLHRAKVPETFLSYVQSLANRPVQYVTCLLCYMSQDHAFVEQLQTDLRAHGVLCSAIPYDTLLQTKRERIDALSELINVYDILLLVVSGDSLTEEAHQVLNAVVKDALGRERLAKEREAVVPLLFPLYLDKHPQAMRGVWYKLLQHAKRSMRNFAHWRDPTAYQEVLKQLLDDLSV